MSGRGRSQRPYVVTGALPSGHKLRQYGAWSEAREIARRLRRGARNFQTTLRRIAKAEL